MSNQFCVVNLGELNTTRSLSEYNFAQALYNGQEDAFESIYKLYWPQVFSASYSRLKNKEDAENITQDVFISLWEQREKALIKNMQGYLLTLTKHKTLNYILKKKPTLLEDYEMDIMGESTAAYPLLFKEAEAKLQKSILQLPSQQRSVFQLRYVEHRSTDEIASELGLSVKTVRNHLGKALSSLKTVFKIILLFFLT